MQERSLHPDGFYDTGNLLTDPFSGQPVSIVQTEILEELLGKNLLERLKYMEEKPGELKSTEIVSLRPHYLSLKTIGQEREADTGSDTGEILYSDPWRRGMYTRSGDGSYF